MSAFAHQFGLFACLGVDLGGLQPTAHEDYEKAKVQLEAELEKAQKEVEDLFEGIFHG